ncbi:hypothetical protein ACJZ2D_008633 [Fusarium nematophilum]
MTANTTLFMTPEEAGRVRQAVKDIMQKRKEQTGQPRKFSDPDSLIQQATSTSLMHDLSSAAFELGRSKKSKETMVAYAVGNPYPPCTANLGDLEPMKLSELRVETHHRGRVLFLRRVSPVVELEACSWAVVQAESSHEVERIEVFLHKSKYGRDILDVCSELFIKEPYYTLNNQGEATIRVDHPSDLVVSAFSHGPESWRLRNRGSSQLLRPPGMCKEEGNFALQKNDLGTAHSSYTEGLMSISKENQATETLAKDLYRNRSHVNLLLQRFDEAKTDALSALTRGEAEEQQLLDAKAYYRAGLAAYALGDFPDARSYFQKQEQLHPGTQYACFNLRRIEARLREKATGSYSLKRVVTELSKNQGRPDVTSFNGPTEVKNSPGAGRGLFATRDIEPNDIIICERAFCVVWGYDPGALSALTCDIRDDAAIRVFPAGLHKAVVQKLLNNPSQAEMVLDLFGDYRGLGNKLRESDGSPIIDTFQVHDIIQRNAFGPGQQTKDEDISNASTGLWIRASYINHSCVPNTKKDYIGDLMILRATGRISAGEEILHAYDESGDYDVRVTALQSTWGFKCGCALCAAEEADGPDVRRLRRDVKDRLNAFIEAENAAGASRALVRRAKRLRRSLQDTYDKERYKGLPQRALLGIEEWLRVATST